MFVKKLINNCILDNREINVNLEKKIIKGRKGELIFYKIFVIGKEYLIKFFILIEKLYLLNKFWY